MKNELRIGVLGAAKTTKNSLIRPAHEVDGVRVAAVAARNPERARRYAARHGIPRVHVSYENLLADKTLDAVYIPLPAAMHGQWTIASLNAGKHVLVEKPFAANAEEARFLTEAAHGQSRIVMEAHHSCHHPLMSRVKEILSSGDLGAINTADASFCVTIPPGQDIRWNPALGGGSLMDVGCYPLRLLLDLFGPELPTVEYAAAKTRGEIDRSMRATLNFGGIKATINCAIWSPRLFAADLTVHCDRGRLRVKMPFHPHDGARIAVDGPGLSLREGTSGRSSYSYQLQAFRDAVLYGAPTLTSPAAANATMTIIDSIYLAAGLQPRQPYSGSDTSTVSGCSEPVTSARK
ncbi:Gfo/Idh/MocA family protein [Pseudarthrobacter sp. NPDC058329]|uniref:Gfo/Idh/MocA family protein n=1 Tax=Pseudarthrobacter sp. NPDC058329 TaxID=3346448 RepID=UPI0036DD9D4A